METKMEEVEEKISFGCYNLKTKMEEKVNDYCPKYLYYNERLTEAMNEMIKQNDYNEQHNTGPQPFTASQPCQYLSLDSSNAFTLGVSETILTNFSDTLTTFSEEERIKELTKHINN